MHENFSHVHEYMGEGRKFFIGGGIARETTIGVKA
jgi:hypothetical protein